MDVVGISRSGGRGRFVGIVVVALLALGAVGVAGWVWFHRDPDADARAAYDRGDWSSAADLARARLAEVPGDREAVRLLARASARLGRDPAAKALFGRLGSESWEAEDYALLGRVLARANQPELAAESWALALGKDRDHPEALASLVEYNHRKDRLDAASSLAERLAERPGWTVRGLVALAELRAELGDLAAADDAFRRVFGSDRDRDRRAAERAAARPDDPLGTPPEAAIRKRWARVLLRLGKAAEARAILGETSSRDDPEVAWLESRAAVQLGDLAAFSEAIERSGTYRDEHRIEPEPAPFVGSDRCADCHRSVHSSASKGLHARTFHRAHELAELALPPPGTVDPLDPKLSHTFQRGEGGRSLSFETKVDGQTFRAIVDYAFGSGDRGLSLVGRDGAGQTRELRLSRYGDLAAGWDVTTGHVPHPDPPANALGRPLSSDMARGCLFCHTTDPFGVRTGRGPAASDRAIGCERCHGPGGNHVAVVSAGSGLAALDLAIGVEAGLASSTEINRLCGECHSPRGGAVASPDDPSSVRFQATTLTWGRCQTETGEPLGCLTCHNPHRDASTRAEHYEKRCRSCHERSGPATPVASPSTRARTVCPVNPSSGCLACHMPVVRTPMIPHSPFTDHFIRVRRDVKERPTQSGSP